jgi:hypothetical protein
MLRCEESKKIDRHLSNFFGVKERLRGGYIGGSTAHEMESWRRRCWVPYSECESRAKGVRQPA